MGIFGKGRRIRVDVEVLFHFFSVFSSFIFISEYVLFYSMVYSLVPMYHFISHHRYMLTVLLVVLVSATSLGLQGLSLKGGALSRPWSTI